MIKMKKLIAGVSALVAGIACATAVSAGWEIKGYDTSALIKESFNKYSVAIVYELYDNNGLSTGVVVSGKQASLYGLKPYAEASFSEPAFELAWPNREFIAVYADGVATGKFLYNGVSENLEYRCPNYMWELAKPHRIYRRTQAWINNEWYTDTTYPVFYAGDVATVQAEYKNYYGFGDWRIEDADGDGLADGIKYWTPDIVDGNPNLVQYMNTDDNIYYTTIIGEDKIAVDALDAGAVTDLTWASDIQIKKTFSLVVSGPQFNYDGTITPGNEFACVYSAADHKDSLTLHNFAVPELVRNIYSHDGSQALCNIEWVDAGFEMAVPYRYYQILKLDGVLLDGSTVKGEKLPYVYRYIIDADGNFATANLTSTWDSELTGYQWNDIVGKYEFLVDIIETVSIPNGPVVAVNRTKNVPSNVFGQLNYSEGFVGGNKVITATLEGIALNGEIYSMTFTGSTMEDINWGLPTFNNIKATLDPIVENADDIVIRG